MPVHIGCDVGTVSVKVAVVTDDLGELFASLAHSELAELPHRSTHLAGWRIFVAGQTRLRGDPQETAVRVLGNLRSLLPTDHPAGVCVTGSGGRPISDRLGLPFENEFRSLAKGVGLLLPEVSDIFEIGGEQAKYLGIVTNPTTGEVGVRDYETNGDCAAGTGSFLDQQATRLCYPIEEVGAVATSAERASNIAGRCSVFAKSDMIHAQQRGAPPRDVLRGLCEAIARNYKACVVKGRSIDGTAAFVGGVAQNRGVVRALGEVLELNGRLLTPPHPSHYTAVGAALLCEENGPGSSLELADDLGRCADRRSTLPTWIPLDLTKVKSLRDRPETRHLQNESSPVPVYLGVDVGSVSTNLVAADARGRLLHEIYLRTQGRPVQVVSEGLREMAESLGEQVEVRGVGTTGSGRELIGELIGADAVNDEITAHKTGAFHIAREHLGTGVDTIFEIGGQDSKYIHLRDGVVVDFAMNEACAAGTGSFLEEQAEKLGVNIIDQFSQLALQAKQPVKLGERCTVFMERDVAAFQQKGAELPDLMAGLAYAVVQNYLNRVVRDRPVGEVVFFQGGTAYNDSVAAAFAEILGKPVVVPPHNGVVGAYGAALLAQEKMSALQHRTLFRGFHLERVERSMRTFTCGGCTNRCDIQEFTIEERKSYWGDKCSEKFRRAARTPVEPVIPDLMSLHGKLLEKDYFDDFLRGADDADSSSLAERAHRLSRRRGHAPTIGVPRAMYFFDRFPFWNTYLRALGFHVHVSPGTNKRLTDLGVEATVAEPCHPILVAHGHAVSLLRQEIDLLFLPNVITAPGGDGQHCYLCPWGQTLPFVVRSSPAAERWADRIRSPTVHFQRGPETVERGLWSMATEFGVGRRHHRVALALAYRAQQRFETAVRAAGTAALDELAAQGAPGIALVGRPYNLYDTGINLGVAKKLRSLYGANVIPLDFVPAQNEDVQDVGPNMYWNYGRRLLRTARFASRNPQLHLLYLTNFKCGPDSYVKQFAADAAIDPFLVLQFDGHDNDAGILTRCEAYLDSIGVLRWWQQRDPSAGEPSTCRACAPAVRNSLPLHSVA